MPARRYSKRLGSLTGGVRAVTAMIVAATLVGLGASAARAGTIWVTDGNMNAGQTGACSAFGFSGDLAAFITPGSCPMTIENVTPVPAGQNAFWMTTAPPGITINSAWTAKGDVAATALPSGLVAGDFWQSNATGAYGGSTLASGQDWFNTALEGTSDINSQIYGIQLVCTHSASQGPCGSSAGALTVSGIELSGTETSAPTVTGIGSLLTGGQYVWNPPGDSWWVSMTASDVSGACDMWAYINDVLIQAPAQPRDNTVWEQCPNPGSWGFLVDTHTYVPGGGDLTVQLNAANAAGVAGSTSSVVHVDNAPVGVLLSTPTDPTPSVWINHSVTVDATPTAGPSGVGGMDCKVDRAAASSYPATGLIADGDGVHTVSCTAWNNAVDPQGEPNTGTSSTTIHIDEAPPSLSFAPQDPNNPTTLTVKTSDAESGVAGGSLEMAPAGTGNWTTLPTTFDGSDLVTHFDDAGHTGPYTFQATSCDNVGNCATASEQLTLPLRGASDSQVSLTKIVTKIVKCPTRRAHAGWRHRRAKRTCTAPKSGPTKTLHVPYGRPVTVNGLYTTAQGVPLGGQPVHILAAPNNGLAPFNQIAVVTTSADGTWMARLPAGPSRIIQAVTDGTATLLPSSGQVTTIVPAKVRLLKVWPRHVGWGGTVHLVGQLLGGYLPPGGALVRLRIGFGSTYNTYGVEEHVMGDGRFSTVASFGPGDPSVHRTYWFQIASLPMGNYPYAPAASQRVTVHVGGHPSRRCCRPG